MIKTGKKDTEILGLLLLDTKLGDEVAQTALDCSVEYQNADTLETVLTHLAHIDKLDEAHLL